MYEMDSTWHRIVFEEINSLTGFLFFSEVRDIGGYPESLKGEREEGRAIVYPEETLDVIAHGEGEASELGRTGRTRGNCD